MRPVVIKVYLCLIAWLISSDAISQEIQWASSVDFVYNQFSENKQSALEVLGPPNASPYGTLSDNAFRLNGASSFGTIVVNYDHPQIVKNVIIVESHLPGKIINIILYDDQGTRYQVYEKESGNLEPTSRVLIVNVGKTQHLINRVELNIDTQINKGWTQIDAIGLSELNLAELKKSLYNLGLTHVQEEFSFGDEKVRLGSNINTAYNETRPVISHDGKFLYFCRQNYPSNLRGIQDPQDIYYSEWINGDWTLAKNIGAPLNDINANGINSISPDGNTLFLINEYSNRYGEFTDGVSLSFRTENGWSFPEKMLISDYYNLNAYADFYLSADGKALILAIEREDTQGDQDLYICLEQWGNTWSAPINLGNVINSKRAEFAPFLSADGSILYFASEGHGGFGQSDIYFSERLDEDWLNWSEPQNMGSMVNSPYWDAYFTTTPDNEYGYFVSTKGSDGGSKDIFKIPFKNETKPRPIMMLAGQITDKETQAPLAGLVEVRSLETNELLGSSRSNPQDGLYKVMIPLSHEYYLTCRSGGYLSYEDTIQVSDTLTDNYLDMSIGLEEILVGQTMVLRNINFVQSKAVFLEDAYPELERLSQFLQENPNLVVELGGHTDATGSYDLNMDLSEERVIVVKNYLEERGIDGDRLQIKAYGSSRPLASNATEETRRLNRRVEIKILELRN